MGSQCKFNCNYFLAQIRLKFFWMRQPTFNHQILLKIVCLLMNSTQNHRNYSTCLKKLDCSKIILTTTVWITSNVELFYKLLVLLTIKTRSHVFLHKFAADTLSELKWRLHQHFLDPDYSARKMSHFKIHLSQSWKTPCCMMLLTRNVQHKQIYTDRKQMNSSWGLGGMQTAKGYEVSLRENSTVIKSDSGNAFTMLPIY